MMLKKLQVELSHFICTFYQWGLTAANKTLLHRIAGFIFLGLMSRLLPHPPNFTALNAIALFSICSLGSLRASFFTVFAPLMLSTLIFGFYPDVGFVYLSFGLIILIGYGLKRNRSLMKTTFLLALSALLFFVISNFGTWLGGSIYPKTLTGLGMCYLAALPFFANNLLGTLVYGSMLFGWLTIAERKTSMVVPHQISSI